MTQITPHKGMRFLHTSWKQCQYSLEEMKTLPKEQTAMEFEITKIAKGVVYYRGIHRHSDREDLGGCMKCDVAELGQYILKITRERQT